jgi:hypothetical protein
MIGVSLSDQAKIGVISRPFTKKNNQTIYDPVVYFSYSDHDAVYYYD